MPKQSENFYFSYFSKVHSYTTGYNKKYIYYELISKNTIFGPPANPLPLLLYMDIISYVRHGYNNIIDHVEGAPGFLAFPSRGARPPSHVHYPYIIRTFNDSDFGKFVSFIATILNMSFKVYICDRKLKLQVIMKV